MERLTDVGYIPERVVSNMTQGQLAEIYKRLCEYENTGLKPQDMPDALEMCQIKLALDNLAEYHNTGLTPEQIAELSQTAQHWANEARIQAAAAGEMKIALANRLETIRILKRINRSLLEKPENSMHRELLEQNRIQYEDQEQWLVEMLEGRKVAMVGENTTGGRNTEVPAKWRSQMMGKFMERR